jgi:hypothetical protein
LADLLVPEEGTVERVEDESELVTKIVDRAPGRGKGRESECLWTSLVIEVHLMHGIFALSKHDAVLERSHSFTSQRPPNVLAITCGGKPTATSPAKRDRRPR